MPGIDQVKQILKISPQRDDLARIFNDASALPYLVETRGNLVASARERSVGCLCAVGSIGQKTPIFGIEYEENAIEEEQALLLAEFEISVGIERVRRV